jgi:hypothetical protein
MEYSDPYERTNFLIYQPDRDLYSDFYAWSSCDMYGCTVPTSDSEKAALVDFYHSTQGDWWRINHNWLTGDPCINHWYGITCNTKGQIISFHMFENRIDGLMPDSFGDLVHLKHLTIANDGREHEFIDNPHRNSLYLWNAAVFQKLTNLEEINMQHLGMKGSLTGSLSNLFNLRYLNLGYN